MINPLDKRTEGKVGMFELQIKQNQNFKTTCLKQARNLFKTKSEFIKNIS